MELKLIFIVVAIMTCFVVYVEYKTMGEDMQARMGRAFDTLVANNTRLQNNINKLQTEYNSLKEWKESAEKKIQNLENKVDKIQNTLANYNNNNNNNNTNNNNNYNSNSEEIKEKRSYKLAVGILTRHDAKDRRDVIRDTWIRLLDDHPLKNFTYKFVVGQIPDKPEQYQKTIEENKTTGDILFIDSIDSYYNISYKSMEIFRWATEDLNTEFVFKTDDDTFLRLDKLVEGLDRLPKERFYGGHSIGNYSPHRDPGSQWYVPESEYPKSRGPVLLSGSGYILSKDCAAFLAQKSHEPDIKYVRLEDVNTMNLLEQMGVSGTNLDGYLFLGGCENDMVMSHYRSSDEMKNYYKNIKDRVDICTEPKKTKRSLETVDLDICNHPITVNY